MHPDQEQLQRYLHGELTDSQATQIRGHLETCAECRATVDAAAHEEADLHALFEQLDHGRVHPSADEIPYLARRSGFYRYRRAAAVLLALGLAASAYAIPGSPVRNWVNMLLGRDTATGNEAATAIEPSSLPDLTGVEVEPGNSLIIDFVRAQSQGNAIVSLTDSATVLVRGPNGAARFTSEPGHLLIDNTGTATFYVRVPRSARHIEIRIAGQPILLKQGDSVTAARPADTTGTYALPLK
jgi:anti-sigma factor RsiW